jgi:putative Mg2+ transporter-C (MgtC) family protein
VKAIQNINLISLADTLISLAAAFLFGAIIGFERQYRQRTAGLRTNVLVAVGAAIFVDMAHRLFGSEGAIRVAAYVVSGVGFLGAGVIMREQGNVRGLNTAATLWGSAAVGACAGGDLILEAAVGAGFVLAANTMLRPVVNRINRQPMAGPAVEVAYLLHLIAPRNRQKEALARLENALERSGLHPVDLRVHPFGESEVEIEARLAAEGGDRLDALVDSLNADPLVNQAFWSPSALD